MYHARSMYHESKYPRLDMPLSSETGTSANVIMNVSKLAKWFRGKSEESQNQIKFSRSYKGYI